MGSFLGYIWIASLDREFESWAMIGEAWFTCAPPISAVSRGFMIRLPPTIDWPIATDFMRAPSLAVELLFAASSSTNYIIGLQHYSLFQGSMTWSLSLSISCCCLLALVCYMVVLLSSEWFLPVILLNIEISIESSLCVSFSVCVCASSPTLFRSLELTTTTLPSFFISSSLPLPIFVLGRPKTLQVLSSHHVYWMRHFPLWSRLARRSDPSRALPVSGGRGTWWRAVKKQFCECVWVLENVISS